MTRNALPWLLLLVAAAGLALFLLRPADRIAEPKGLVTVQEPSAAPAAHGAALPPPELIGVVVQGARSVGRFRLAKGDVHTVAVGELAQPGWTLRVLDSGSATFATPTGMQRVALVAPPAPADKAFAKTVLVPEVPAVSGDGETVARCTDPEC